MANPGLGFMNLSTLEKGHGMIGRSKCSTRRGSAIAGVVSLKAPMPLPKGKERAYRS